MSVTTRLFPDTSDDSGGDLDPFGGFATGWQGLGDASDGTGVAKQLSPTENVRHLEGTFANLPVGVGAVKTVQVGVREFCDRASACQMSVVLGGIGRIGVSPMPTSVTEDLSALLTAYTTAPMVDALTWGLVVQYISQPGPIASITRLWIDVDWNPAIGGLRAQMFSVLGPLVAVGLHEIPGIAAALWRRARTRLSPDEYVRAWRALRDDRGRVYFL